MTNFAEQEEVIRETPFDRLGAYLDDLKKTRETDHSRILDEHAEYLQALIAIDSLLDNIDSYLHPDERTVLLKQIRAAMPASIIATRKEN